MEKAKMTVMMVDVELTFPDTDVPIETSVGVVVGDWNEGMIETDLDSQSYFYFDELADIVLGADTGDNIVISKILSKPYVNVEEYKKI